MGVTLPQRMLTTTERKRRKAQREYERVTERDRQRKSGTSN